MRLDVGLKEWAVVCDLLVQGRVSLVLRKGGVFEREGPGRFCLEHERFLLYPAVEHERLDWVKPGLVEEALPLGPEGRVWIRGWAEVAGIVAVPGVAAGGRERFDRLDDLHAWTSGQIDMRFGYKPDRPLYAVVLRTFAFAESVELEDREAYRGCRSWVPLEAGDAVEVGEAHRVGQLDGGAVDGVDGVVARVKEALLG